MARRPTVAARSWTIAGLVLAVAHLALLSSIALFDDGRLDPLWSERIWWLVIVAMPAGLPALGLRNPSALLAAAIISVPLSMASLAGAALPLLVIAICYVAAYAVLGADGGPVRRHPISSAGTALAVVTYVLLAPFRCNGEMVQIWSEAMKCKGLIAFEYPGRSFVAPQLVITSLVVGALATFVVWLVVRLPDAGPLGRVVAGWMLVVVTAIAAMSLGGTMMLAAPVLLPMYWWMACRSGRVAKILWSLLAVAVTFYAASLLAYVMWLSPLWGVVPLVLALGVGLLVLNAPDSRKPDPWARP